MYKRKKSLLSSINSMIDDGKRIEEVKQQYETPIKTSEPIPDNNKGADGDRKVVKESDGEYLYIKSSGRWMKLQLQEVE
jgi:hypothetical protein